MNEYKLADLRYCPTVGQNVIMQRVRRQDGEHIECLNKSDCDFAKNGCKNSLILKFQPIDRHLDECV